MQVFCFQRLLFRHSMKTKLVCCDATSFIVWYCVLIFKGEDSLDFETSARARVSLALKSTKEKAFLQQCYVSSRLLVR